jgi:thymidine phosphorylase
MQVLQGDKKAPADLRARALMLAGHVLEFSPKVKAGEGQSLAEKILSSGQAFKKFQAICRAQGELRDIPIAAYQGDYCAKQSGVVTSINNFGISRVAKLAGAPTAKAAGLELHVKLGMRVLKGQPLFTLHSESQGQLRYVKDYLRKQEEIIQIS